VQSRVRDATPADLDALVAIEERCFSTDRISRRSMRRLIGSSSAIVLVLDEGDAIGGYALFLTRAGSEGARLYSLAIEPSRSGKGAGASLLEAAEEIVRRRGHARIHLEVREDNTPAIMLYRRFGYAELHRIAHYYADGKAALKFAKSLR
jgi:ribosomal protein S18 acetylase RimI-like enzyme